MRGPIANRPLMRGRVRGRMQFEPSGPANFPENHRLTRLLTVLLHRLQEHPTSPYLSRLESSMNPTRRDFFQTNRNWVEAAAAVFVSI